MPFEFDTSSDEDMAEKGGNFLQEPGTYHLHIVSVDEAPTTAKNVALDGFRVECSVLEGKEASKTVELLFFYPSQAASEASNKWSRSKITAFLESTGLTHESQRGSKVNVNLQDAVNRQVIANLQHKTDKDGNAQKFLELAYANMYHVDNPNPRAAKCPKNMTALAILPKALRRDPGSFPKHDDGGIVPTAPKVGAGATTTGNGQPAMAGAASNVSDDLGDL